jgi:protein TonB
MDKKTAVNEEKDSDENIYDVVEQMPSFQGGQGALLSFLSTTVKYPAEAQANGIQGRVTVSFVD